MKHYKTQRKIAKKEKSQTYCKSWKKTGSRLPKNLGLISLFSILIFSFSCSSSSKKAFEDDIPKVVLHNLSNVCLGSAGRGRLQFYSEKYRFEYETRHNQGNWHASLLLPLNGEETLFLDYSDVQNSNVKVKGSFYKKLVNSLRDSNNEKRLRRLNRFIVNLGHLYHLVDLAKGNVTSSKLKCNPANQFNESECQNVYSNGKIFHFRWKTKSEGFELITTLEANLDLKFKSPQLIENQYNRLILNAFNPQAIRGNETLYLFETAAAQCNSVN